MKIRNLLRNVILLTAVAALPTLSAQPQLEPGQPFPLLTLPTIADGQLKSLQDFAGQRLIVHVWASW